MTAKIISGKELSQAIKADINKKVNLLAKKFRAPCLAVILVGEDLASQVYVRNKVKACEGCGITSILEKLPEETPEEILLKKIEQFNNDDSIDGILVQLPLPKHISESKVIEQISVKKDVDGFSLENVGALCTGMPGFKACTPYGVMKMLESTAINLTGKHALIIGRSNIVGKPMALMLLEKNATVTIAHSKTVNLAELGRDADILVAAVGKANFVKKDMVKPGAIVIDVGINRGTDGKLCGDVDFEEVKEVAGYITPVPGGVGPMTITMLLQNTLEAAELKSIKEQGN